MTVQGQDFGRTANSEEAPFRFRPSRPFRYPDDFPWKGALHARAVPVIMFKPLADQKNALSGAKGEEKVFAAAQRLLALYRNLNLEPLFVIHAGLPAKELSKGHKKKGKPGGLPALAHKMALLGCRVLLLAGEGNMWKAVQGLVSDPLLFHPALIPYTRRSTLCCLLERAAKSPKISHCPCSLAGPGWPLYLAKGDLASLALGTASLDGIARQAQDKGLLDELSTLPQDPLQERYASLLQKSLSPEEALALLRFLNVPERGIAHAMAVGRTAKVLAMHYILKGEPVDEDLSCAAGYVHDIAKGFGHHEKIGGHFLDFLGLSDLARCVRDHRDLVLAKDEDVSPRELVYLADKYCFGPRFVPLERRFGMKMELFADNEKAVAGIQKRLSHALALEKRIRRELKKSPADIARDTLN